jgi:hypothetical protein
MKTQTKQFKAKPHILFIVAMLCSSTLFAADCLHSFNTNVISAQVTYDIGMENCNSLLISHGPLHYSVCSQDESAYFNAGLNEALAEYCRCDPHSPSC